MKSISAICCLLFFCTAAICQTANFTYQSTTGPYCTPSTIKFTQTSTGNPTGFVWTFGNNNGSNMVNPTFTFTTSGTFTVRLIVIYKKRTITVTKSIVVNPAVVAHFEMDRNNLCTPGIIQFRANPYPNISSYEWDFGDHSNIVSTTSPNIGHHYADFGNYPISLKVTVQSGCSGKSFTSVVVKKPVLHATVTPESGCTPAAVRFNATVGLPPGSTVTNYLWEYGDGSPNSMTTVPNSVHIYQASGNYNPSVHITTNDGCSNEIILNKIAFGTPPSNHIAYPKLLEFCGSESPEFVSKAVNANRYFWDFGEGDTTSVTDTVMRHKFKTLGNKTVTVTPLYNNCPGTPISFTIHVIGVIASYNYSNTCTDKKTFTINNNSQGNQSTITWNLGDASPVMQSINVIHSFPDTGTFKTSLYVTDSITGCVDSVSRNIYTANPILVNPDNSICKNNNTTFNIQYNYNNPAALYNWQVIGIQRGPDQIVPLTINANIHGIFNDNFVIIDNGPQYCPDTTSMTDNIIVRGPILDFNAASEICLSNPLFVTNRSRPYLPADAIIDWKWNYGMPEWKDSVFQPRPYPFPYWGTFTVTLSAIDIKGCADSLEKNVIVRDVPFLRSIPDMDTLCSGQNLTLIAFHNDPITWFPLNSISCSGCDTVIANPSVTTTYYVKATSRFNCSTTDSIIVYVYAPFTAVAKKINNYICYNASVQLEVKPGMKMISWSPKTGLSDSTISNPVASPKHSTTYIATLTDSVGCFSSSTSVNVYVNPLPTVDAGQNKTYPYNTQFSFTPSYSNNVISYNWISSTLLSCSNCAIPEGIATSTQSYTITVTSDSGCVASDQVSISIDCNGASLLLPTAFTPNRDNLNDYFYPITRGIRKIVRFSIYDRQGQMVFEAKNFIPNNKLVGWDGNIKGNPQNSATYVYFIESVCDIGEILNKKGSFMLIK